MKIKTAELERVCGITSKLPENHFPEVALCGRSNVGKSSLINTIINRKRYARTSSEPGKTQTINYYLLNSCLYLVDLPGYGYARISKEMREKWGLMIQEYLTGSEMLRYVFMLVDLRHAPSKDDIKMFNWLKYLEFDPVVIATKSDKLKPVQKENNLKIIRHDLGADEDTIILPFSAVSHEGLPEILDLLSQVVEQGI